MCFLDTTTVVSSVPETTIESIAGETEEVNIGVEETTLTPTVDDLVVKKVDDEEPKSKLGKTVK